MAQSQKPTPKKSSQSTNRDPKQTTNRLTTFETDKDELLIVMAGRGEMDNRTIYSGSTSGRYAIVPVDELAGEVDGDSLEQDLRLVELQLIGSTAMVEESGEKRARLSVGGLENASRDAASVYGLQWVPSE